MIRPGRQVTARYGWNLYTRVTEYPFGITTIAGDLA